MAPTLADVQKRVLMVIREIVPDVSDLSLEFSLANELDSIDRITLFMALEEEFGGKVDQKDAEQINTVNDAVQFIYKRLASDDLGVDNDFRYDLDQPAAKH